MAEEWEWIAVLVGLMLLEWIAVVVGLMLQRRLRLLMLQQKLRLPPGPAGLPVLGNLPIFTSSKVLPHHELTSLAKKHGPVMLLRLGSAPCVVLSSPEACRDMYRDQDQNFANRPVSTAVDYLLYGGDDVGFLPYGPKWKYLRKVVMVQLMTSRKIQQFASLREAHASILSRAIYRDAENGRPTNVDYAVRAYILNIITQICFSRTFFQFHEPDSDSVAQNEQFQSDELALEINPKEAKVFTELIADIFRLLGVKLIGDYVPFLSFLDRFNDLRPELRHCCKRADDFLTALLEEHRTNPNHNNPDFLDNLLKIQARDGNEYLGDTTIKSIAQAMLLGGTDTSSNTLHWAMAELVRHPQVAAKMQAELDSVVGKERLVTEADIPHLPFLQAIVKETLRLHPALALSTPHLCLQPTKLMGYDIPANTTAFVNIWGLGRMEAIWDKPQEFRPERFMERPDIDAKGQHYELLPFGSGRRVCPGMNLGIIMVQYSLARLLQAFTWSPPKGMKPEEVDMDEGWGFTVPRAHHLEALATPRLHYHLYWSPSSH